MSQDQTPAPVEVKSSAVPIITQESAKTLIIAGGTYFVATHIHDGQMQAAIIPGVAVLATMAVSAWQRLHTWGALKRIAAAVDDSVAIIGKRK